VSLEASSRRHPARFRVAKRHVHHGIYSPLRANDDETSTLRKFTLEGDR